MRILAAILTSFFCVALMTQFAFAYAKSASKKKAVKKPTAAKTSAAVNEYRLLNVATYVNDSNTYEAWVPAVVVSDSTIAVRVDATNNLEDLSMQSRVFVTSPHFIQVYPVDVDINSRWLLLKSVQRLPLTAAKFATKSTPSQLAKIFKYDEAGPFIHDIAEMRVRAATQRNLASIAEQNFIEGKLEAFGDRLASSIQGARKRLKIETFTLAPEVEGMRCRSSSPVVRSEELQSSIFGGSGLNCESQFSLPLSQNFSFAYHTQLGALHLQGVAIQSEPARMQLLQNISINEIHDIRQISSQVKYSTPTICESSHLTDKNVDVFFCTRTLRGFRTLNDSLMVMGHASGTNYIYNIVRASGFSSESTHNIFQANINVLGANP